MDVGALAVVVVPTLTAVTGLVSSVAALMSSRSQLRLIDVEAKRTGVAPTSDTIALALRIANELQSRNSR